ncbi:MAG: hypothetical protein KJO79_09130 [Verrucomicrobiae bacterium]|nr:hypothetical protein [Verrucomicrobiae bacterium]NNJ87331.1 hypothetical protein [Akkermansiaceae bacterium]
MNIRTNEKAINRAVTIWVSLLACISLLASCDKPTKANPNSYLAFSLHEVDGNATMITEGFTIIFEGEEYKASSGSELQVGGSSGPTEVNVHELTGKYEGGSQTSDGVCTVEFRKHTFKLSDEGRRLLIGGVDIDVSSPEKIITVSKDGNVSVKKK